MVFLGLKYDPLQIVRINGACRAQYFCHAESESQFVALRKLPAIEVGRGNGDISGIPLRSFLPSRMDFLYVITRYRARRQIIFIRKNAGSDAGEISRTKIEHVFVATGFNSEEVLAEAGFQRNRKVIAI